MKTFVLLVLLATLSIVSAETCFHPPPSSNYSQQLYEGFLYEVGKIQTRGGAFFERNCVCTAINVTYANDGTGKAVANETCRDKTVTGKLTTVYGILTPTGTPGNWIETISGGVGSVNYTVIEIGSDYAVEYDCGVNDLGVVNYCLHYMSRTETMDAALLNELVAATSYLNAENLPLTHTLQQGCW